MTWWPSGTPVSDSEAISRSPPSPNTAMAADRQGAVGAGRSAPPSWAGPRQAVSVCCYRPNLRRTATISLTVGTVLVGINQTGPLVRGQVSGLLIARLLLDYLVPFVVSNLGVLAGSRRI